MFGEIFVQFMNTISFAMVLILGAIGLSIIFGLMGVINMAHGELFMMGAYVAVLIQRWGTNLWLGIAMAPFLVGIIGLAIELVVRRFYTRPLVTLPATWGLSMIIRQLVKMFVGVGNQSLINPLSGSMDILGILYPKYRILLLGVTGIVLVFLFVVFQKTVFGLKCRAIMQHREMSSVSGINVIRMDQWTFTLGAALAGFAGAMMAPLITVHPEMGQIFLAQSFLVVILGGVGNLFGIIGGAILISGTRFLLSYFVRLTVAQIVVFVVAIMVMRLRPQGLFGTKT
jgi:urea transport system permease protein